MYVIGAHGSSYCIKSLAGVRERSKPLVSSSVNKLYASINNYNYLKPSFFLTLRFFLHKLFYFPLEHVLNIHNA